MKYQNVTCIINPSSGKDTPILGAINNIVQKSDNRWRLHITQEPGDIQRYTKMGLEKNSDLIIVYGGDGSIMEATRALVSTQTPLLILPGGTANVISKELSLPQNPQDVFNLLQKDKLIIQNVDVGVLNEIPFLLRVNFGLLADMVKETSPETKQNYGQLAYGLTIASQLQNVKHKKYTLKLDEKTIEIQAIGLMVTNMGSIGIGNLSIHPSVAIADGLLDIIIIESLDFGSIVGLAATTLTNSGFRENLKHYQAKQIVITPAIEESVVCDDEEMKDSSYTFSVLPESLHVLSTVSAS